MNYWKIVNPYFPTSPSGLNRSPLNLTISRLPSDKSPTQLEFRFDASSAHVSLDGSVLSPRLHVERELYFQENLEYLQDVGSPTGDCATCTMHSILDTEGLKISYGLLAESLIVEKSVCDYQGDTYWHLHHCSATHKNMVNVLNCYSKDDWKTGEIRMRDDSLLDVKTLVRSADFIPYAIIRVKNHVFPIFNGVSPEVERYACEEVRSISVPERFCARLNSAYKRILAQRKNEFLQEVLF